MSKKSYLPLTIKKKLIILHQCKFHTDQQFNHENRIRTMTESTIDPALATKITPIRMILMDVDGVLTDGSIIWDDQGVQSKVFNVKDGFGIHWIRKLGIKTGIITGKTSDIVLHRARELDLDEVHQGEIQKLPVYEKIKVKYGFSDQQIAYVGDDILDLPLLLQVGFSAAPADAHSEILKRVDFVSQYSGGRGAVREIIELIIKAHGKWEPFLSDIVNWTKS
jgi:3-deoxy-D-manno-octulosonate 8-phosphate phosphatase (KDO 8-P phosphatase)